MMSVVEFGSSETLDPLMRSAGGPAVLPGAYLWSNQRLPYAQSGQWGYFRVLPRQDQRILRLAVDDKPRVAETRVE
jgi:manganese oxidase